MGDNFYSILEVPETATMDEIKKSYRRLSLIHHPDKNNNSSDSVARFQKIGEAYDVLGDAEKKQEYDMSRNNPFIKMMGQPGGFQGGNNPMDDILSSLFGFPMQGMPGMGGHQMGGHQMGGHQMGHMGFGFPMNMGGIHMGGGGFGPNVRVFHNGQPINIQQQIQKPPPIVMNITVPIDKILSSTTVPIDIERWIIENGNKVFEHETVYVTIPKGIDEGEMIILKDKGNSINEECKGDIKIVVKIENTTDFQRSGLDLVLQKTISIKEALCGFVFELKYITGKTYTINNNAGNIIPNGYRKIIPNMGFTREEHTGNLIIVFDVKFPEKLSDEALEALKNIEF
jgi:DnaJ family protein B protein 4